MRVAIFPFVLTVLTCLGLVSFPTITHADDAPTLQVLEQVGGIQATHDFSLSNLQALGQDRFVTSTIWTDGEVAFEGVYATTVLKHLGIETGTLEIVAANDYFVEIPVADLLNSEALIAYTMNGEAMSTRDKGPLWLVYPFDSDVSYQSETYYARSIWQINKIRVLP